MRSFATTLVLLAASVLPVLSQQCSAAVTVTVTVTAGVENPTSNLTSTTSQTVGSTTVSTSSTPTPTSNGLGSECTAPLGSGTAGTNDPWWLESMPHIGTAAFNANPSTYKVYRNVKDYGAKGDGVTDDTAAINAAISDGNRCGLGCKSTTTAPAIVYFPSGNYVVSAPIIPFYYTALVGNPKNRPTITAAASFTGMAVIDADPYIANGQYWVNQNNFFRAVRNFNIDLTRMPVTSTATGLHWQVAQATSLAFVKVIMSQDASTNHQGIFMENGSGGVMTDLEFVGGRLGVFVGNQQFTVRNAKFSNNQIAIQAIWNWGWTWQNVQIENCGVGIDIKTGGTTQDNQTVGAELLLDFTVKDTPIFVRTTTDQPNSLGGSILIDNAQLTNVPIAVGTEAGATTLAGSTGSTTIASWAQGNIYSGSLTTATYVRSNITPASKPASLLDSSGKVLGLPRPQYETYAPSQFVSVKANGAKGDGTTDDTAALQAIFDKFAGCKIIFFDAGTYVISDTLRIPPNTDIVGEMWSQILVKGTNFSDVNNPRVALKFGNTGDQGYLRVSDIVVSTVAGSAGAIVMEINIQESSQGSVGFWDTHVRLGGSTGTGLTNLTCPKLQNHGIECSAAFLAAHITSGASAYMENVWLWTADHQLDDDSNESQIDVFSGRGILVEGKNVWLIGTASEHHVLYQYRFVNAQNVYAGLIQTETPYFQPNPAAPNPFSIQSSIKDPDLSGTQSAIALSIEDSSDILIYGAGLYSFFDSYTQTCLDTWNCQSEIVRISNSSGIRVYSLSTVGTTTQLTFNGQKVIAQSQNQNGFASTATAWSSETLTTARKRSILHKRRLPTLSRVRGSY
ncbi:putative glucan 1,3-beta-glucosidase [Serendipita vermifera]|nr:putative glucan 1,3-beta-glucosidase [Serendipita vermifera]